MACAFVGRTPHRNERRPLPFPQKGGPATDRFVGRRQISLYERRAISDAEGGRVRAGRELSGGVRLQGHNRGLQVGGGHSRELSGHISLGRTSGHISLEENFWPYQSRICPSPIFPYKISIFLHSSRQLLVPPPSLPRFTTSLILRSNRISQIAQMQFLPNLAHLDLSDNQIRSLPSDFLSNLPSLQEL